MIRAACVPGGTCFFTLVVLYRSRLLDSAERVSQWREAFKHVRRQRPFMLYAGVILPDHLHCIMQLPPDDSDFSGCCRKIKKRFSRSVETRTNTRGARPVRQRCVFEYIIRDEDDGCQHVDDISCNAIKHGLVAPPTDRPWSSFQRAVEPEWYDANWGATPMQIDVGKGRE